MSIPAPMLRRAIQREKGEATSPEDLKRVLEIASLAVASDGRLADEERAALRVLASELNAAPSSELDALVHAALNVPSRDERLERLRVSCGALSTEGARHLAYKLSVVIALADLASADEEFEFDLDVQEALELPADVADRLTAEVHEALMPDEIPQP